MASSFKEKLKTQASKSSKQMYYFCLNLPPKSCINPSHFRKINWLPVKDRVEYFTANTVFKPSLCRCSKRSQMTLDIPLQKTNTVQKNLSFLGPKIWSKMDLVSKMVKYCLLFCTFLRKIFYFICKTNSNNYHILMIEIFI